MKRTKLSTRIHAFGAVVLLLCAILSCVRDDIEKCGLEVSLRYVYNMQEADGLAAQATLVSLWVFDEEHRLVGRYQDEREDLDRNYTLSLPLLPRGRYTFVAMAKSTQATGETADFVVPHLSDGAFIDELTERLERDGNGENACALNTLLNGTLEATVTGEYQRLQIDLMKCTNTLRLLLFPLSSDIPLEADDWEVRIEGKNGWLAYDASTYEEDTLTYRPYYTATLNEADTTMAGGSLQGVVMELSTSRLMYDLQPRLVLHNRRTQREVVNINLTWLLSLQAIGEHLGKWSNQEYLDRQDHYVITFLIDGDTWMKSRVAVNGWVLSLQDIGLGEETKEKKMP